MKPEMALNLFMSGMLAFICFTMSGCGTKSGWAFSIGLHPVNSIDDHHKLERDPRLHDSKDRY